MKKLILLLFFFSAAQAQILHSAQLEIVGSPGWYQPISLNKEGLILILKEDQTRFKVVRYTTDLRKVWEQELFFDTEEGPKSYTLYDHRIALLFSETSGMYYQWIDFDINTGEYQRKGFELRDYFVDKGIGILNGQMILVGTDKEGLSLFVFDGENGSLVHTQWKGNLEIQEVKIGEHIEVLALEKTLGYSNEKKKKGEYVKSTQVVYAHLSSSGEILSKKVIVPTGGKFPMNGRRAGDHVIGVYKEPDGNRGVFISSIREVKNSPQFFTPFEEVLGDKNAKYLKAAEYKLVNPIASEEGSLMGGAFYTNITDKSGLAMGWEYSTAQVFTVSDEMVQRHTLPLKLQTPKGAQPFALNSAGAVAYVGNGKLWVRNFNIGSRPIAYALSEDKPSSFVPGYRQVLHWYDNVFLGIGTQSKMEAQQVKGTGKKKRPIPYTQTRKTFFLTAISAGIAN